MLAAQRALTGLAAPALLHEIPGADIAPSVVRAGQSLRRQASPRVVRRAEVGAEGVEFVKRRCDQETGRSAPPAARRAALTAPVRGRPGPPSFPSGRRSTVGRSGDESQEIGRPRWLGQGLIIQARKKLRSVNPRNEVGMSEKCQKNPAAGGEAIRGQPASIVAPQMPADASGPGGPGSLPARGSGKEVTLPSPPPLR